MTRSMYGFCHGGRGAVQISVDQVIMATAQACEECPTAVALQSMEQRLPGTGSIELTVALANGLIEELAESGDFAAIQANFGGSPTRGRLG